MLATWGSGHSIQPVHVYYACCEDWTLATILQVASVFGGHTRITTKDPIQWCFTAEMLNCLQFYFVDFQAVLQSRLFSYSSTNSEIQGGTVEIKSG